MYIKLYIIYTVPKVIAISGKYFRENSRQRFCVSEVFAKEMSKNLGGEK
jgi:hypothetical protein